MLNVFNEVTSSHNHNLVIVPASINLCFCFLEASLSKIYHLCSQSIGQSQCFKSQKQKRWTLRIIENHIRTSNILESKKRRSGTENFKILENLIKTSGKVLILFLMNSPKFVFILYVKFHL